MARARSRDKFVPDFVKDGGWKCIKAFLGAYFACDGSVYSKKGRNDTYTCAVDCVSVSPRLVRDVQHLLLRIGVDSYIRRRAMNYIRKDGTRTIVYRLTLRTIHDSWRCFRQLEGYWLGRKFDRFYEFSNMLPQRIDETYLPDRVVDISPVGKKDCRCLTVKHGESFVAEDIVVHNSTYCSVIAPAWLAGRKPNFNVIAASYGDKLAVRFGRRVREIVKQDIYQEIMGTK